jgi:hypothetical protein
MDIGSSKRLAMREFQILIQPKLGLYHSGSFHPASQTKTNYLLDLHPTTFIYVILGLGGSGVSLPVCFYFLMGNTGVPNPV